MLNMKRLAAAIISIVFIFNACSRHAAENKIFNTAETEGKAAKLAEWEEPPELELERERGESLLARMMAGMIVVTFIGVLIYYGSRTEPSRDNPTYRQYGFVYQRDLYDDLADQELRDQLRAPQDAPPPPPANPPVRTGMRAPQHAPPPPPANPPVQAGLRAQAEILQRNAQPPNER